MGKSNGTANEQYFSSAPQSADVRKTLEVTLRDHPVTVETSNGVFSAHRVDLGTSVLLRHAPEVQGCLLHGLDLALGNQCET